MFRWDWPVHLLSLGTGRGPASSALNMSRHVWRRVKYICALFFYPVAECKRSSLQYSSTSARDQEWQPLNVQRSYLPPLLRVPMLLTSGRVASANGFFYWHSYFTAHFVGGGGGRGISCSGTFYQIDLGWRVGRGNGVQWDRRLCRDIKEIQVWWVNNPLATCCEWQQKHKNTLYKYKVKICEKRGPHNKTI